MNKKAALTMELMLWILRIIVLTILIFAIGLMIRKYMIVQVDVSNAENLLLISYLQKTPIIHQTDDITGITSRSIIDLNKLNANTDSLLDNQIFYGENQKHICAKISLFDNSNKLIQDLFYNKKLYSDLKVKLEAQGIWKKDVESYVYSQPITLKKDDELTSGKIIIEVLQ